MPLSRRPLMLNKTPDVEAILFKYAFDDAKHDLKLAEANHTRALQALEAAYQKNKAEFERNRILPFATFRAQEVSDG